MNDLDQKKVLCIIPARGGSKGLPRKNIRDFNGKPLIAWTIIEAKKSKFIDKVVVSTEDEEISKISAEFGAEIIRRPIDLAADISKTEDVILHVVQMLKKDEYIPDSIIVLQCTSPLRTAKHIDEAIEKFISNDSIDSLISVSKQEHPPWWMKTLDEDGKLVDFIPYNKEQYTRRQDFPKVYFINGAIYVIKTEKFIEFMKFQLDRTGSYIMDSLSSIDIDTEIDFITAEYIMKNINQITTD